MALKIDGSPDYLGSPDDPGRPTTSLARVAPSDANSKIALFEMEGNQLRLGRFLPPGNIPGDAEISLSQPVKKRVDALPSGPNRSIPDPPETQPKVEISTQLDSTEGSSNPSAPAADMNGYQAIVAAVRDHDGNVASGVLARLRRGQRVLDVTRTNHQGMALLLFGEPSAGLSEPSDSKAPFSIEVIAKDEVVSVELTHTDGDIGIVDVQINETPKLTATAPNLLARLPAEHSPQLASTLITIAGASSQMDEVAAKDRGDRVRHFRRHVAVPRIGPDGGRFLVMVRQDWTYLGEALGNIHDANAILPQQTATSERSTSDQLSSEALGATLPYDRIANRIVGRPRLEEQTQPTEPALAIHSLPSLAGFWVADGRFDLVSKEANQAVRDQAERLIGAKKINRQPEARTIEQRSPDALRATNFLNIDLNERFLVRSAIETVFRVDGLVPSPQDATTVPSLTVRELLAMWPVWSELLRFDGVLEDQRLLQEMVERERVDLAVPSEIEIVLDFESMLADGLATLRVGQDTAKAVLPAGKGTVTISVQNPSNRSRRDIREFVLELSLEVPSTSISIDGDQDNADLRELLERVHRSSRDDLLDQASITVSPVAAHFQSKEGTLESIDSIEVVGSRFLRGPEKRRWTFDVTPEKIDARKVNSIVDHILDQQGRYLRTALAAAWKFPEWRQRLQSLLGIDADDSVWESKLIGFDGASALYVVPAHQDDAFAKELLRDPGSAMLVHLPTGSTFTQTSPIDVEAPSDLHAEADGVKQGRSLELARSMLQQLGVDATLAELMPKDPNLSPDSVDRPGRTEDLTKTTETIVKKLHEQSSQIA
ncbi:MAG: hypothetical protein ACPGQL_00195 [Thermoplasmatota archaeon]